MLNCPVSGVELRIPKGAIPPGEKHEIYVKVSFFVRLIGVREGNIAVQKLQKSVFSRSGGAVLLSGRDICPRNIFVNVPYPVN